MKKSKKLFEKIDKKSSGISQSYEIGKQFYNKQITKKNGIEKLIENGINANSAIDYLNLFSKLIQGELYVNIIDNEYIQYYFEKIHEEYKEEGTKNALLAFTQHLDFYKNITKENSIISKDIFDKYWDMIFVHRSTHPNDDTAETYYIGGRNGIITRKKSVTNLWGEYRKYSNLLAERLGMPNNNLTEAYSIYLIKTYYNKLTELTNQKNYFENEKGEIYLIKSINTDDSNSFEFEISNLKFDYLVIFIYDLKKSPTYRLEVPIEVVKKYCKEYNSKYIITINEKFLTDKKVKDIYMNIIIMEYL